MDGFVRSSDEWVIPGVGAPPEPRNRGIVSARCTGAGREIVRLRGLVPSLTMTARRGVAVPAIALLLIVPGRAHAQEDALVAACAQFGSPAEVRQFCNLVAQGIETVQPRLGLAFTGGNPVPGTASTLGMRIGTLPRLSLGGRLTAVLADLPPIREAGDRDDIDFVLPTLNADASVGIFGGFSPAPTVGGVGSVDALASAGLLPLPNDDGFEDDAVLSWALGARLGLLRESFTLPGISVSGTYRWVQDVTFGDRELTDANAIDAFFHNDDFSVLSVRGAVSKRIFTVGATAGVGYDRYSSDVLLGVESGTTELVVGQENFDNDRVTAFANVSWTLLILHAVGEIGWQSGGDMVPGALPAGVEIDPEEGALFGSLAIRLSI